MSEVIVTPYREIGRGQAEKRERKLGGNRVRSGDEDTAG